MYYKTSRVTAFTFTAMFLSKPISSGSLAATRCGKSSDQICPMVYDDQLTVLSGRNRSIRRPRIVDARCAVSAGFTKRGAGSKGPWERQPRLGQRGHWLVYGNGTSLRLWYRPVAHQQLSIRARYDACEERKASELLAAGS